MAASIYMTASGSEIAGGELELIADMVREHGRVALLVSSYAEGETCSRSLARAGLGTGVEVLTPTAWVEGLWRLVGDGTRLVSSGQRSLLTLKVLAALAQRDAAALAPLSLTPGSAHMIGEMARLCLPEALACDSSARAGLSAAEAKSLDVLRAYDEALAAAGLVECSQAAERLGTRAGGGLPSLGRAVVVRGLNEFPEYLLVLLGAVAREGSLALVLPEGRAEMAPVLAERFAAGVSGLSGDAPAAPAPRFARVGGPTARVASYAVFAHRAFLGAGAPAQDLAMACPEPLALAPKIAPRLVALGHGLRVEGSLPFAETRAGQAFFQLVDLLDRMEGAERSAWWPAPELVDWTRSPFSGVGPVSTYTTRALDAYLRKSRTLDKDAVMREMEKRQSRVSSRERDNAERFGREPRPVVCHSVLERIEIGRFGSALQLMRNAAAAAPAAWFGEAGTLAQRMELRALDRAIEFLGEAFTLGVPGNLALIPLQRLIVPWSLEWMPAASEPAGVVRLMRLDALAALEAGSFDTALLVDAGAADYPLSERDTPASLLAAKLGSAPVRPAPLVIQRERFARAGQAARRACGIAFVERDNGAAELYPAATVAEMLAPFGKNPPLVEGLPGEAALVANLDASRGAGMCVDDAPRQPMHRLPAELAEYVVLPKRCVGERVVPRALSASQIETYLSCPYRWFVNSRVGANRLDVEFGPIERGNFAHDVMQRFYERLRDAGLNRVTSATLGRCLEEMDVAFDETREDHLLGRYTHGKYAQGEKKRPVRGGLVPLDEIERSRLEAMRDMFHKVVRHEASMLGIFVPSQFELSFDKEGLSYAGRPLGGRIDRVDVAPDAGNGERFVVIDYKTGASVDEMACPDPTVGLDGDLPADWLPGRDRDRSPKVQTLMYATALEHMGFGQAQGAVYYGLRGQKVAGAASSALLESEPPAFPEDKVNGFPGIGGTKKKPLVGSIDFGELLERVEATISLELDRMEEGDLEPRPASDSCSFCPITMCEKRR